MRHLWMALAIALSLPIPAFPCSCVSSHACPGPGGKDNPVFLGTVLSVADSPPAAIQNFFARRRAARIRVDEPFGGLPPGVREVEVVTGVGGGDCGVGFKPGEGWLVAAYLGEDGRLQASICGHTRKADQAGAAIRILRLRRDGLPIPTLAGRIAQYDRSFDHRMGTLDPKPLSNVSVRVRSGANSYETRSDPDGLFAFYNLPSGRYQFDPRLPPGTTQAWYIGSDDPPRPFEIEAARCQVRDIDIFPSASIQGRVLGSSRQELPRTFVYIVPASQTVLAEHRKLYWEYQEKDGFKFVHIPPGDYRIVVNPADQLLPEFPYPRTFYPNARDLSSASIVTIRPGEQIRGADIRVEPSFTPRNLAVRVMWADGRVIRDFVSIQANATANPRAAAHTSRPNLKLAEFELKIVPDEPYEIQAELTCLYADHRSAGPGASLKSNKLLVQPGDRQTELLLKMPAAACPHVPGKSLLTEQ